MSITAAVVSLVQANLHAVDDGWTRPGTVVGFALSAALFATFVAGERRAEDPLVALEVFRSRTMFNGVALAILGGSVRASTFVLVALYLQRGLDMSPQAAGLAMVPTSLTGFAANLVLLPRVLRRVGPRRSLVAGLVVLAAGQLWLAWAPAAAGYVVSVLPGLLLVAVGVALSFTPTTMVITSAAPASHAGLASGWRARPPRSVPPSAPRCSPRSPSPVGPATSRGSPTRSPRQRLSQPAPLPWAASTGIRGARDAPRSPMADRRDPTLVIAPGRATSDQMSLDSSATKAATETQEFAMTTSLIIEEDRGTYTRRERRHNGYYGGDFSSQPVLSPRDLLAQLGGSSKEYLA